MPSQRLYARSEYVGSNMELAMCKNIAERPVGEILASSEWGKGADRPVPPRFEAKVREAARRCPEDAVIIEE